MIDAYKVETKIVVEWMKQTAKDCGCPAAILQPSPTGKYPLDSDYFTQVAYLIAERSVGIPQSIRASLHKAIDYRHQVNQYYIAGKHPSRLANSDKNHQGFILELVKVRSILEDLPVICNGLSVAKQSPVNKLGSENTPGS